MEKMIWFDMDGTIADLYGVENWLQYLIAEDVKPYAEAKPLVKMQVLARILNNKQKKGYKIGVVSWLSKSGSEAYNEAVTEAKKMWLKKHLASVQFDRIDIIKYGEPKQNGRNGFLFDDEIGNRNAWGENAFDVDDIIGILKAI